MSGVKRYDCDPCHEHICRFEREESESGEYVLASDYVALEAERDELLEQVEAMRAILVEARLMTFVVNSGQSGVLRGMIDAAMGKGEQS